MNNIISEVMKRREKSWLGGAELKVFHRGGVKCQKEMRRMYSTLTDGATCFRGTYYCDNCDIAVEVILRAHPDIPYEIYQDSGEIAKENELQ